MTCSRDLDIAVEHDDSGAMASKDEQNDGKGSVFFWVKEASIPSAVVDSVHHEGWDPQHQHAAPVDIDLDFNEQCWYDHTDSGVPA